MRALLLAAVLLASPSAAETVAVTGATVWTNTADRPLENATVVIRDGLIVSVGSEPPPAGARLIPGRGRVVTPALDAAATQVGLVDSPGTGDVDDRALGADGAFSAGFDVAFAFDPNGLPVQKARAEGLSAALIHPGAASGGVLAGQAARIRLAASEARVERRGAAVFVHAGGSAADTVGGSRGAIWTFLHAAFDEAPALAARPAGGEQGGLLSRADARALLPVLRRETPLAVVADREADLRQALQLARERDIRVVVLGGAEAWRLARELAAAKVPVVLDPLDDLPVSHDALGARPDNAALLAAAGVEIAFAVSGQGIYYSHVVGPALRGGAGVAVANGLPYAQALRAVTLAPKRIWDGDAARGGVLAPGQPADFVVWDGDPLEPGSAPVAVFSGGEEVSRVTRQTLLRDRYAPTRRDKPR